MGHLKFIAIFILVYVLTSCTIHRNIENDISLLTQQSISLKGRVDELELKIKENQESIRKLAGAILTINESSLDANSRLTEIEKKLSGGANIEGDNTQNRRLPKSNDFSNSTPKPTTKTNARSSNESSWRCQAITKKGTQCKRSAQPGRRFCWQH